MKRIAVLTSGGDAPGMNAAIRAATRTAVQNGADVVGVRQGYAGLICGDFRRLTARDVAGIVELGGTMLESMRCPDFKTCEGRAKAVAALNREDIDGVIVVGGDGSSVRAIVDIPVGTVKHVYDATCPASPAPTEMIRAGLGTI